MITARTGILAASAMTAGILAAAVVFAVPASAQIYSLGTGKQGFFTYSAGAAIAKVAADGGLNLRISPFGGSSAYVPGVNAGEQPFGLANELETDFFAQGGRLRLQFICVAELLFAGVHARHIGARTAERADAQI